jgi:hypothetical protein
VKESNIKSIPNEVNVYVTKDGFRSCLNDTLEEKGYCKKISVFDVNMNTIEAKEKNISDSSFYNSSINGYSIEKTDEFNSKINDLKQYLKDNLKISEASIACETNTKTIDNKSKSKLNFELASRSKPKSCDEANIFLYGTKVKPLQSLNRSEVHDIIKKYLHLHGFNEINAYESYMWPILMTGHHLLAVNSNVKQFFYTQANSKKDKYISILVPLLTTLLDEIECKLSEREDILATKAQNGPITMIVCSSCANAQRLFELTLEIMQSKKNLLKVILLQGK